MAQLLGLNESAAEESLNAMVVDKTVEAKIDRLDGIVDFRREKDPNEMLNEWSHNISDLLGLVMKTTHLVTTLILKTFCIEPPKDLYSFYFDRSMFPDPFTSQVRTTYILLGSNLVPCKI